MSILDIKRFSCERNVPNIPNSTQTVFILPFYTKLQASIRSPSTSSLISLLPLSSTLMNMKASLYTQTYLHLAHIKPSLTFILAVLGICIRDSSTTASPTPAAANHNTIARLDATFLLLASSLRSPIFIFIGYL